MTTQTLEFLTDAELQAVSGGGFMSAFGKGLSKGANWAAKNPDKVIDGISTVHDAVSSKGQLQDLQLGIA